MTKKEFEFVLEQGEGQFIEFKKSFDKSLAKEIVAFANAQGGKIYLGITDKKEIKGINVSNSLKSQILDIARNCDPAIKVTLSAFDKLLVVEVEEGKNKPFSCSSGFYLRIGANSQKLSRDEIFEFAISEGRVKFDEQINKEFSYPADFDKKKLDEYLSEANLKKTIDNESILINLGVAKRVKSELKFNNAGVLFFAKNPSRFFLSSKIVCAMFQGNERVNILDRRIYDDGILRNIKDAITYVKKHIDVKFVIKTARRQEIEQFPEEAYRELIVNAVMHRDYLNTASDILIEVHKNKFVVSNPGGLVRWLKKENFGKESQTRNTIIASLLSRTIFAEKMGTGIKRIMDAVKLANLPNPTFNYSEHSFKGELFDERFGKKVDDLKAEKIPEKSQKNTRKVPEKYQKIINVIKENPYLSRKELSVKLGETEETIQSRLRKLVKEQIIKRVGPDKGGHWEIIAK